MILEDELLAIAELVAEAGSTNPATRKQELLDGLVHLLGADCWIYSHYQRDVEPASLTLVSSTYGGDENLGELLEPVWFSCPFLKRMVSGKDITVLRREIVQDNEWSPSEPWPAAYKALGLGDFIVSRKQVSLGTVAELAVHRRARRPVFQDRHTILVRAINTRVHWLHKRTAAKAKTAADPTNMPARQRQILQELLAGESPKRIARNLGLTSSTVRTYIKHLYRRLSVNTRGELLSKFIAQTPTERAKTKDLMGKQG